MTQPFLDWSRDVTLPVSGRTPGARHASSTGAQVAALTRGDATRRYLALLREGGPLSDHEAARMMGCGTSSINSIRNGCRGLVAESGTYEEMAWPGGKITKRVRWQRVEGR
jgi:hypothetical protein